MSKEKRFREDSEYRIYRILHLAKKYGWILENSDQEKFKFKDKAGSIIQINYLHLKIDTALNHPKWGKTTLERSGALTHKIVESIFRNPRKHMPSTVKSKYVK